MSFLAIQIFRRVKNRPITPHFIVMYIITVIRLYYVRVKHVTESGITDLGVYKLTNFCTESIVNTA